jgi:hypothetical protein
VSRDLGSIENQRMHPSSTDISAAVDRWVSTGIVTSEQAQRIRADLSTHAPRRGSLVAEALGYLGGIIVLVGLGLVLALSWDSLDPAGRTGVAAGITVALLLSGVPIPVSRLGAAGTRLRAVLWTAATVGAAASLGLLADEILKWRDAQVVLFWSGGAAVLSAVLWAANRHILQHLTTIAATLLAAYWGVDALTRANGLSEPLPGVLSGLAVWAVGVAWFALAWRDIVPRRGGPVLGALGTVIGGLLMLGYYWGPLFAVATMVALTVIAVALRELAVLSVSSIGTLIALPFAVHEYLPGGALSTALALVAAGLALVATGVYTARRRRPA